MRRFGPHHVPVGQARCPSASPLVQDEMAQLLGCSRQRVNVELKAMERDGVIRMAQRGITILDLAQLETRRSRKTRLEPSA